MTQSKKILKFKNLAIEQAFTSQHKEQQHGAVISRGSRVVASGSNGPRNKFIGMLDICQHAEMNAATRLINTGHPNIRKMKPIFKLDDKALYDLKDYIIWVVRIKIHKDKSYTVDDSAPCRLCLERLKKLGFGKIAYSTSDGAMVINKLNEITTSYISFAQVRRVIEAYGTRDIVDIRTLGLVGLSELVKAVSRKSKKQHSASAKLTRQEFIDIMDHMEVL